MLQFVAYLLLGAVLPVVFIIVWIFLARLGRRRRAVPRSFYWWSISVCVLLATIGVIQLVSANVTHSDALSDLTSGFIVLLLIVNAVGGAMALAILRALDVR